MRQAQRHIPTVGAILIAFAVSIAFAFFFPKYAFAGNVLINSAPSSSPQLFAAYQLISGEVSADGTELMTASAGYPVPQELYAELGLPENKSTYLKDLPPLIASSTTSAAAKIEAYASENENYKPDAILISGTPCAIRSGYWLFISQTSSPIFALVGNSDITLNATVSSPILSFYVSDGSGWRDAISTYPSGSISYKASVEVPIGFFNSKKDTTGMLTVSLGEGISADASSVRVIAANRVLDSSQFKVKSDSGKLSVEISELESLPSSMTEISVEFDAAVHKAGTGADSPYTVQAVFTYALDGTNGSTLPINVNAYSYELIIHVSDIDDPEKPLVGTKFSLRKNATQEYVAEDGARSGKELILYTDGDGNAHIRGVEGGTYTLHEIKSSFGYDTVKDIEITIQPTIDKGNLIALSALASDKYEMNADYKSGKVNIDVPNPVKPVTSIQERNVFEDITDAAIMAFRTNGWQIMIVAAIVVVGVGVIWYGNRRQKRKPEDNETGDRHSREHTRDANDNACSSKREGEPTGGEEESVPESERD